jgi:hypothetical protein
MIMIDSF